MSRNALLVLTAAVMALLLVLFLAGGPNEAGALAGLSGHGTGLAVGLAWIVLFPAAALIVPPLLLTAAAEALHARLGARGPHGLGSRSGPGDT